MPSANGGTRRPQVLTWTGGGEHGQRGLFLAVLLVSTHELLLTLQDAEIRGYCCIEHIVHPCRKEGCVQLPLTSKSAGSRADFTGGSRAPRPSCSISPPFHHEPQKPRTVSYLLLQTINMGRFSTRKYVCFPSRSLYVYTYINTSQWP